MSGSYYLTIGKFSIIFISLCIACFAIMIFTIIRRATNKTKRYKGDYMAIGMLLGISFGSVIGMVFDKSGLGIVIGMSLGEIIGMTIGLLIPKK